MAPRAGGAGASWSWKTPPEIAAELVAYFDIRLDVCADADNAVAPRFIDEAMDAFRTAWHDVAQIWKTFTDEDRTVMAPRPFAAWMNPPYGYANLQRWGELAVTKAQDEGVTTVALVPLSPDAGWWSLVDEYADEVLTIRGRVIYHERDPITGIYGPARGKNCPKCRDADGKRISFAVCPCPETEGNVQGPNFASALVIWRPPMPGLLPAAPRWGTYVQPRLRLFGGRIQLNPPSAFNRDGSPR